MANWTHMIRPYNPSRRKDRDAALVRSLWLAFAHFWEKADRLSIEPDGQGLPWFDITLHVGDEPVYKIIAHEQMAFFCADSADVAALLEAGVDRDLLFAWVEPASQVLSTQVQPAKSRPTHSLHGPTRAEWLAALRIAARRADRFAVYWRDEPPAANGWDSKYGIDRLLPFCSQQGKPWEIEGVLTPEALGVLLTLQPTGIPDLEHHVPPYLRPGQVAAAPWWWLILRNGSDVLFESGDNGVHLSLSLSDGEAAELAAVAPSLRDHATRERMALAFARLKGYLRHHRRDAVAGPDAAAHTAVEADGSHHWEVQKGDSVVRSLSVDDATLRRLAPMPKPEQVLVNLPREAVHVVVELVDGEVRWRQRC